MNKNFIIKLVVIFALLMLFNGTAQAWPWSDWFGLDDNGASEKLKEIERKKESLTENTRAMKFMNSNMFDEGVDTVEISIKNKGKILKTYYIVRAENRSGTPSIIENVPNDTDVLWKFKPNVDQASDGLDQASNGFLILEQSERSKIEVVAFLMKGLYMYYTVENENVPSLNELVKKSSCGKCKKALSWIGF